MTDIKIKPLEWKENKGMICEWLTAQAFGREYTVEWDDEETVVAFCLQGDSAFQIYEGTGWEAAKSAAQNHWDASVRSLIQEPSQ